MASSPISTMASTPSASSDNKPLAAKKLQTPSSALKRFQEGWSALDTREDFGKDEAAMLFNCHQSLMEYAMDSPTADTEKKSGFYCILIGDQTSGKTTLLTRLSKQAAFVVKDGVGTKVRTYCQVRYNPYVTDVQCTLEYTDPADGKRKVMENIPAKQLSEEYHHIYGGSAAYDFQNITRCIVDVPEPTFGLSVLDVMGLTASVPQDQITSLIAMQRKMVRDELLCANPNAIGVICHAMDKTVSDASWPQHLVQGHLERVREGNLVVAITRMDLIQVSTVARMIVKNRGRDTSVSPYEILQMIKDKFLDDCGLPRHVPIFFVASFAGDSSSLLYEPDAMRRFEQFMDNRQYGERAIEAKMLRILSMEEKARWGEEGVTLRENTEQEQEMFDACVGNKAVFGYLLRKQLNEPMMRAAEVAADVHQKMMTSTNSRRQCERDFRGQEKHKLTVDTNALITEACKRFFTLSVNGGLDPQDEAFDFFENMESSLGMSVMEERRLCEILTNGNFPNFPENGNYESPHFLNHQMLAKQNNDGVQASVPVSTIFGNGTDNPRLQGAELVAAQKQHMVNQLIDICGGDNASSINAKNYMLDVLQNRSIRDYFMMLTLYPRQTLDTRALLKRSVGRKELNVDQSLTNKIEQDYGAIFYGDKLQGGANQYIATRVALNAYAQMDAAVKTVCYDSAPQNVVKTSQMAELLHAQLGEDAEKVDFAQLGAGTPDLIGKNADILQQSVELAHEEMPLELQELNAANSGVHREERGKQYTLQQVLRERAEAEEAKEQEKESKKPVTPWGDVRQVLHNYFYEEIRQSLETKLNDSSKGMTQMLNPQSALMMQYMSLFLYQDPGYVSEWMSQYPKSSYKGLFNNAGLPDGVAAAHADGQHNMHGPIGNAAAALAQQQMNSVVEMPNFDQMEPQESAAMKSRDEEREARRAEKRAARAARERENNDQENADENEMSRRDSTGEPRPRRSTSRSGSRRSVRHMPEEEMEQDQQVDEVGAPMMGATALTTQKSSRRDREGKRERNRTDRSAPVTGEAGEMQIAQHSAASTEAVQVPTELQGNDSGYYAHYNSFAGNTPFSQGSLGKYFEDSHTQKMVTPKDAAHIMSNALTANFTPYHIIRPENIAMPNSTEATFSERSMEFAYQRNMSTGVVQSLMASRWFIAEELSRFKSYATQKVLVEKCQEGLMSLYLGYCKPLTAAKRPQHLLFLSLEFVIPVIYRFRHELMAAFVKGDEPGTVAAIQKARDAANLPWLAAVGEKGGVESSLAGAREIEYEGDNDAKSENGDEKDESGLLAPLSFGWLERKVLLHSPVADAVIAKFRNARSDEQRLRIVDNIETWNDYFNMGNREALHVDMLQMLSQHRYEHINSGERLEERMNLARSEEVFWKDMKTKVAQYKDVLEARGKDMLVMLETE